MPIESTQIVGDDIDDHKWSEEVIWHARTCDYPRGTVYTYSTAQATIYVDSIFNLVKAELVGAECPQQQLADEAQKVSPSSKLLRYSLLPPVLNC